MTSFSKTRKKCHIFPFQFQFFRIFPLTICVSFLPIAFALLRIFALIWHFSCFGKVAKCRVGHGHGLAQVYVAGFCIHPQNSWVVSGI